MIVLLLIRRCVCETCNGTFDLDTNQDLPAQCPICGSFIWNGREALDQNRIRHGQTRKKKVLNPGATSSKRQEWGRKQWRQFKPKPVDDQEKPV